MVLHRRLRRIGRCEVVGMSDIELISMLILAWFCVKFVLDTFGVSNIIALYVAWDFIAKLWELGAS